MSAHAYTEDQLVEQPAIGLFAEFGGHHRRTRDLLLPRLLSGQVSLPAAEKVGSLSPNQNQS